MLSGGLGGLHAGGSGGLPSSIESDSPRAYASAVGHGRRTGPVGGRASSNGSDSALSSSAASVLQAETTDIKAARTAFMMSDWNFPKHPPSPVLTSGVPRSPLAPSTGRRSGAPASSSSLLGQHLGLTPTASEVDTAATDSDSILSNVSDSTSADLSPPVRSASGSTASHAARDAFMSASWNFSN